MKKPRNAAIIEHALKILENLELPPNHWKLLTLDEPLKRHMYLTCAKIVDDGDVVIDSAFGREAMQGLTAREAKECIRYFADRRLQQLGLYRLYYVPRNPLPWLDEDGKERAGRAANGSQMALSMPTATPPPASSTFLLACFARRGRANEEIGDALEEFQKMVGRLGEGRARWWYRWYVVQRAGERILSLGMRVLLLEKLGLFRF